MSSAPGEFIEIIPPMKIVLPALVVKQAFDKRSTFWERASL
jgi:hypothetical protein